MLSKTYESIHKELVQCITREDSLADVSKYFKELKTDSERIAECYCLLRNYDLLPNVCVSKCKKSAEISEKYKNEGNRAFIQKDDMLALYNYNRALTFAPIGSKEFSLALANRSAVTFSLEDYKDSIRDIDRALEGNYPENLKYKLWERKGKALMKLGDNLNAKISLETSIKYLNQANLDDEKLKTFDTHLNSLLVECFSRNDTKKSQVEEKYPKLTHGPNPFIESGSSAIEISHSPEMGRFLKATTDIYPGDIIAIERPYSSITLSNNYLFHCYYCHKRCHSMLPCLECTLVCYCDENCRKSSWEENHSIECSILKPLLRLDCGKLEMLSLRVLITATKKGKFLSSLLSKLAELESFEDPKKKGFSGDVYFSDNYKSIHNLEGNTDSRNVTYLFGRSVVACCMLHILDTCTSFFKNSADVKLPANTKYHYMEEKTGIRWDKIFAGGLLLKYLQSMACNGHEISEMRIMPTCDECRFVSSEIGSAAYPLLSLINHSCDPNIVRHSYFGSTVVVTAIQIIKKGEQIFDNYGFHHATHTKEERHSHLRLQYYFTCQCVACAEDWPLYANLPDKNPNYLPDSDLSAVEVSSKKFRDVLFAIVQYQNTDNLESWLQFLNGYLKLLHYNVRRPWKEYSECQEAIKQCLSFYANHHMYKTYPQSLMSITDKLTGVNPF